MGNAARDLPAVPGVRTETGTIRRSSSPVTETRAAGSHTTTAEPLTMTDLSEIHPDRLSRIRENVNEWPHIMVLSAPVLAYSTDEALSFGSALASGDSHPIARRFVTELLGPLLGVARTCHLYHVAKLKSSNGRFAWDAERQAPHFAERLARYAKKERTAMVVRLDAPGVREDFDFWWYALRHRSLMIGLPADAVEAAALLEGAEGPNYTSISGLSIMLPRSAATRAMSESAAGDVVYVCPRADPRGFESSIIGSHAIVLRIVERLLVAQPRSEEDLAWVRQATTRIVDPQFGYGIAPRFPDILRDHDDPEAALMLRFDRVDEILESRDDVLQTLSAAECVAMIENRPAADLPARVLDSVRKWYDGRVPLDVETIERARHAVVTIVERSPVHARLWRDRAAVKPWIAELAGLKTRLDQALLGRRVRSSAPNAAPAPTMRAIPKALRSPQQFSAMQFFGLAADATALLSLITGETGARAYLMGEGPPRELEPWEFASTIPPDFDERDLESEDHRMVGRGLGVIIWWPDVCSEFLTYIEEDAGIEELGLPPHTRTILGWGLTEIVFCGATEKRLLLSSFAYPTGAELKQRRFKGPGPWRDVDWALLRRKVRTVRAAMADQLAGGRVKGKEPIPVLREAARKVKAGWTLAGKYATSPKPVFIPKA